MHTHAAEGEGQASLGPAAKNVAEHASALVRLEMELAALELQRKVRALAKGIAFGAGAATLLLFALGFGIGAAAAGIATSTSTWIALLIVTGALVLLGLLLGLLALGAIKKGTPPVPEQALHEAKLTTEALKSDGHG
jgi:Putative Actinobacterial Holin-X, holin superfamily III